MKYIYMFILLLLISINELKAQAGEWRVVDTLISNNMTMGYVDIECADDLHCIAVANYGGIPAHTWANITTDGGITWTATLKDTEVIEPYCIAYPDTSLCIIGCFDGIYFRSTDKGFTWEKFVIDSIGVLADIHFYNKDYGVFQYYDVFITTDGGLNWKKTEIKVPNIPDSVYLHAIFDLWIDRPGRIKLLTRYRRKETKAFWGDFITETTDNGETWIRKESWIPDKTEKMFFFDSLNGFLVGRPGTGIDGVYRDHIVETTDGGDSWIPRFDSVFKGDSYGLTQIYFRDRMHGAALGPFYKLLRTSDGGITWIRDSAYAERVTGPVSAFSDIALLSNGDIIGVEDYNSHIWKCSDWTTDVVEENMPDKNNDGMLIYPNPAAEYIEIKIDRWSPSLRWTPSELIIFNSIGECVLTEPIHPMTRSHRMNIEGLPAGAYFVKCGTDVKMFVKMYKN